MSFLYHLQAMPQPCIQELIPHPMVLASRTLKLTS